MEHSELADTILLKKADNFRLASTEEEIVSNMECFFQNITQTFKTKSIQNPIMMDISKFNMLVHITCN